MTSELQFAKFGAYVAGVMDAYHADDGSTPNLDSFVPQAIQIGMAMYGINTKEVE